MIDFSRRSGEKEIIDSTEIAPAEIYQNMRELKFINASLGGHDATLAGLKKLLRNKKVSVCEIGCGGGDNLNAIDKFCKKNEIECELTGIDLNADCIDFAKKSASNEGTAFLHSDFNDVHFSHKPDIIYSSLFCHHFSDQELVTMVKWMRDNCTEGFFINDLHRHPLAYFFIKYSTKMFSGSRLVKNDAPISVMRGFRRKDWEKILSQAGIDNYEISWRWAFRWLIIVRKNYTIVTL